MEIFEIVVGLFSLTAAISALLGFRQSQKANENSAEVRDRIIVVERLLADVEQNLNSKNPSGGNIRVGRGMNVGGGVQTHGGEVKD